MSERPYLLNGPKHFLDPYYVPSYYQLSPDNVIYYLMRGLRMPETYTIVNSRRFAHKDADLEDEWRRYAASLWKQAKW